jgi:hypothetical protein
MKLSDSIYLKVWMRKGVWLVRGRLWKLWAMSLGEKASEDSEEADLVAVIRTVVVLINFITCFFIMSGVVHHW